MKLPPKKRRQLEQQGWQPPTASARGGAWARIEDQRRRRGLADPEKADPAPAEAPVVLDIDDVPEGSDDRTVRSQDSTEIDDGPTAEAAEPVDDLPPAKSPG